MKSVVYLFFVSWTCIILIGCKLGTNSTNSLVIPQPGILDSVIDHYIDNEYYPFIYVRLEDKEGNVLYEHDAVNRRLLPDYQVDENSWIRIWSMSKIVTISLALDLVEDGIISLNDPVTQYIPEFKNLKVAVSDDGESLATIPWGEERNNACPFKVVPSDSVMTVLHLINHQSGFYYATSGYSCLDSIVAEQNLPMAKNTDDFLLRLSKLPLIQHPGTTDFYGINTTVLGMVAERATGKSLQSLIKERITDPLGIKGLQYGLEDPAVLPPKFSGKDSLIRLALPGELDIFGPDVPDYALAHQLYLGGEGMVATADGYADFIRMLLNHGMLNGVRFLEEATVKDIYAPHTQLDNAYGYNGYNLWVSGDSMRIKGEGDQGLWIGGGYESTHFWVDPKREFVGIIMSQMSFARPEGYQRDNAFKGELYKQFFEMESQSE